MNDSIYKKISIYRFHLIIVILILFLIIALYFYITIKPISKFGIIAGGISASLIVALIQYFFSLDEFKYFSEIKKLDIKKILVSRDDEAFYSAFIKNANNKIRVMGVTALRMMNDFASENSPREDKRVLLSVLANGVSVQILLPDKKYLNKPSDQQKHDDSKAIFEKLKQKFKNFEVHYFQHVPTHSIFLVDRECIIGPVFSNYESKDTPCIHMGINNDFANKYLDYFEKEWTESE